MWGRRTSCVPASDACSLASGFGYFRVTWTAGAGSLPHCADRRVADPAADRPPTHARFKLKCNASPLPPRSHLRDPGEAGCEAQATGRSVVWAIASRGAGACLRAQRTTGSQAAQPSGSAGLVEQRLDALLQLRADHTRGASPAVVDLGDHDQVRRPTHLWMTNRASRDQRLPRMRSTAGLARPARARRSHRGRSR
jgi:hypothetical protein